MGWKIISGGLIQTGKVESTDNKTFFDLDNNIIQMNDNSDNNRLTLGNHTGSSYALRISRPGVDMDASTANDDLLFSSEWAIPKYAGVFQSTPHNRSGSETFISEPEILKSWFNRNSAIPLIPIPPIPIKYICFVFPKIFLILFFLFLL